MPATLPVKVVNSAAISITSTAAIWANTQVTSLGEVLVSGQVLLDLSETNRQMLVELCKISMHLASISGLSLDDNDV